MGDISFDEKKDLENNDQEIIQKYASNILHIYGLMKN